MSPEQNEPESVISVAAPKKMRKRKRDPSKWTQIVRKNKRNSGEAYISSRKKLVPAKVVNTYKDCSRSCRMKCSGKITDEERINVFEGYSQLTKVENKIIFVGKYNQIYFLGTLSVSQKTIYSAHASKSEVGNTPQRSVHGKHVKHCIPEAVKQSVFSKMTDEQLIELVKRYPVLYDMNLAVYRDHTVRNNAWEEIAEQMNTHVEDIKNKWGKLRNCFTNALKRRRKKSGQAATNIVPWKFEKQMEFLLPHIEGRSTVTNLADTNVDDSTQDSELQFSEDSTLSPPPIIPHTPRTSSRASAASFTPRRTNKSDNDNYLLKEMVDVMKATQDIRQKRSATDMDENDYFFLSMSKQLKKLPQTDQAEIKFQLHKLIHDSEMKMLNNRERILNTPINRAIDHETQDHYENHEAEKNVYRAERTHDRNDIEKAVLCFDLENCKLSVYNLTAHLSLKQVYYSVWSEHLMGRKGSALLKILSKLRGSKSQLSFAILTFLWKSTSLETISIEYSVPGHSSVQEVEGTHSAIERVLQKTEYYSLLSLIRILLKVNLKNPYKIHQMQLNDFLNFQNISCLLHYHNIYARQC
nr:unnamed protein product [Callosobruchus analis]